MTTAIATKYKPVAIVPESEEHWLQLRTPDITSTEIPALFGISPYLTRFELWHRKKEQLTVRLEQNERMKWGNRLEDAIARGLAEDNGWDIRRIRRYMRIPELRIGSSFDFEIVRQDSLLEIKNVDGLAFKEGWLVEDGEVEAPPHIELQVQHQLTVSQKGAARIGALIGGNYPLLLERKLNPDIRDAIYKESALFWQSIAAGEAPDPDFRRDADFIASLYSSATAGKVLDLSKDLEFRGLAQRYKEAADREKTAEADKKAIKAQMLMKMGDAERVLIDGFSLSAGIVKGGPVSFQREDFRNFRLTKKQESA